MKTNRKALAALSIFAAGAMALTACGGGSGDSAKSDAPASSQAAAKTTPNKPIDASAQPTTKVISTNGTEPQMPLVPTNTTEVGGGKIIDLVFAGLVSFDVDGNVVMEDAASVEPNADNTVWTVKLRDGLKFSDGTPVTADSYIDAWNFGGLASNAQGSLSFFENIKGYDAKKDSPLKGAGLVKKSDTEFVVNLINPEAEFTKRIGYSAFVPLPKSAFDADGKVTKAFGENPVGNGQYKLAAKGAWKHNQGIDLVKSDSYTGPRKVQNGGVKITFYQKTEAAYKDVQGGNLDVLDQVPPANFGTYEKDFADSHVNQPAAVFQGFTIPQYLEHFKPGEEGNLRRQAISLAFDRNLITDKIFENTRVAATDFTSPVLGSYNDHLAGSEVLKFDPTKAKELWEKADAISKYEGTFTISYNSDGGHQEWVDAVANAISKNLGITAEGNAYSSFKALLDDADKDAMKGAFRSGWQADFPAVGNFLTPLFSPTGGSNYGRYDSEEFNKQLAAAGAAKADQANAEYDKAQEILLKDLPMIPLWYANVNGVWNPKLKNVQYGWNSVPLYYQITE